MALNEPFLVALQNPVSTSKALKPYGSVLTDYSRVGSRWGLCLHILTDTDCIDARIPPMAFECAFCLSTLRGHSVEWHNILGCEIGTAMINSRRCPTINDI